MTPHIYTLLLKDVSVKTISEVKNNQLVTYDHFTICDERFSEFKRERLKNNAKTCRGHVSHAVTQGITHPRCSDARSECLAVIPYSDASFRLTPYRNAFWHGSFIVFL